MKTTTTVHLASLPFPSVWCTWSGSNIATAAEKRYFKDRFAVYSCWLVVWLHGNERCNIMLLFILFFFCYSQLRVRRIPLWSHSVLGCVFWAVELWALPPTACQQGKSLNRSQRFCLNHLNNICCRLLHYSHVQRFYRMVFLLLHVLILFVCYITSHSFLKSAAPNFMRYIKHLVYISYILNYVYM